MKRFIAIALACCMALAVSGCKSSDPKEQPIVNQPPTEEPPLAPLFSDAPEGDTVPIPQTRETPATQENTEPPEAGAPLETAALPETTASPEIGANASEGTDAPSLSDDTPETATDAPETEGIQSDEYRYSSLTNATLQVKLLYPEGWQSDPSTDAITMVQPVDEGAVGARFSVTSYKYNYKKASSNRLKDELTSYLKLILADYNEYQLGEAGYDRALADSKGIYATYLAVKGNAYIRGIAIAGYGKNSRVYCAHFCCEESEFDGYAKLIDKLFSNVQVAE